MATKTKKTPAKAGKPVAKKGEYERHPLSEKYGPKMADDELQGLSADIKLHGQHEPIILHEGKVLAGWNRYRACVEAKVPPKFREMEPTADPSAVAFGTNFMRRKLSSVQKAFFGAQFCIDSGSKQSDVAKNLACNLNRLNQCVQLLKLDTDDARRVIAELRDNPDMGGAQFDEHMLEIGIAREPKARPAPARAASGPLDDLDDDDPLGGGSDVDLDDDDLTGGAIDNILGNDDDLGDEDSPQPAIRKAKGNGEIGDDLPLPSVGGKRTKLTNPHETPVSKVARAFKSLSADEQRKFVKFTWGKLKGALDEAFSNGDVQYEMPSIKPDPSLIARGKPTGALDDGHKPATKAKPTPAKKSKPGARTGAAPPAKGNGKAKVKAPPPTKAKAKAKRAAEHDADI